MNTVVDALVDAGLSRLPRDVLEAAMSVCSEKQLQALGLKAYGDSNRRAARRLGISDPTLRERLEMADRKIRAHLFGAELGFNERTGKAWAGHDWVGPVHEHRQAAGWVWQWRRAASVR